MVRASKTHKLHTHTGLNNHHRSSKHAARTPAKQSSRLGKSKAAGKLPTVLKLTVAGDVYEVMTAPVGKRGRKTIECRPDCEWIQQRLDGRRYEHVKMYSSVPYFGEDAEWTMFECLGYECVGVEGEEYEVKDYGDGFVLVFEGRVWEIDLGRVVMRNEHNAGDGGGQTPVGNFDLLGHSDDDNQPLAGGALPRIQQGCRHASRKAAAICQEQAACIASQQQQSQRRWW